MSDHFDKVEAVDVSEKMISIAKKKAKKSNIKNISFKVDSVFNLTYQDDTFDLIIIANVLHIIPNPEQALTEIKRILKQNGTLVCPTFTHKNSLKLRLFTKVVGLIGFKAYSKWSLDSYVTFLENNGLSVKTKSIIDSSYPEAYIEAKKL